MIPLISNSNGWYYQSGLPPGSYVFSILFAPFSWFFCPFYDYPLLGATLFSSSGFINYSSFFSYCFKASLFSSSFSFFSDPSAFRFYSFFPFFFFLFGLSSDYFEGSFTYPSFSSSYFSAYNNFCFNCYLPITSDNSVYRFLSKKEWDFLIS